MKYEPRRVRAAGGRATRSRDRAERLGPKERDARRADRILRSSQRKRAPSAAKRASNPNRQPHLNRIRLLVLDVDGVLTDGGLLYGPSGEEIKRFFVQDGLAVIAARRAGLLVAVISGRASAAVTRRLSELGLSEVHQGVPDKAATLEALMSRLGVLPAEVAVMGDDLPDLALMQRAGLALAPANAVAEVRRAAHWVSSRRGGDGAVREAVELLLGARRAWPPAES